jgi:hypothetical protein
MIAPYRTKPRSPAIVRETRRFRARQNENSTLHAATIGTKRAISELWFWVFASIGTRTTGGAIPPMSPVFYSSVGTFTASRARERMELTRLARSEDR